jgi:hypothetical protein
MAQRIVNTTSTNVAAMKTEKTAMNTPSRYDVSHRRAIVDT